MAGSDPVVVMARIVAQPGKENAIRDALVSIVGPTRHEDGNISYELVQSAENPAEFVTIERWKDASYLATHMQQKYVTDAIAAVGAFFAAAPAIVTYNEITVPN